MPPKYIRLLIAKYISWRREETAKDIYRQIGGKSPILEQTQDQAYELEISGMDNTDTDIRFCRDAILAPVY